MTEERNPDTNREPFDKKRNYLLIFKIVLSSAYGIYRLYKVASRLYDFGKGAVAFLKELLN